MTNNLESIVDDTGIMSSQDMITNPVEESPSVTFQALLFRTELPFLSTPTTLWFSSVPTTPVRVSLCANLSNTSAITQTQWVIKSTTLYRTGTPAGLSAYLRKHAQVRTRGAERIYSGYLFSVQERRISEFWTTNLEPLRSFFCMRILTETRIVNSNPASAIAVLDEPASHPIHMLYRMTSSNIR